MVGIRRFPSSLYFSVLSLARSSRLCSRLYIVSGCRSSPVLDAKELGQLLQVGRTDEVEVFRRENDCCRQLRRWCLSGPTNSSSSRSSSCSRSCSIIAKAPHVVCALFYYDLPRKGMGNKNKVSFSSQYPVCTVLTSSTPLASGNGRRATRRPLNCCLPVSRVADAYHGLCQALLIWHKISTNHTCRRTRDTT